MIETDFWNIIYNNLGLRKVKIECLTGFLRYKIQCVMQDTSLVF
jgi:hypothetical protein